MTEVSDSACPNLDEMNAREVLAELFSEAHTAYTFTDEPVTDQQLHAAYDLAQWAPTGVNGQHFALQSFVVELQSRTC